MRRNVGSEGGRTANAMPAYALLAWVICRVDVPTIPKKGAKAGVNSLAGESARVDAIVGVVVMGRLLCRYRVEGV